MSPDRAVAGRAATSPTGILKDGPTTVTLEPIVTSLDRIDAPLT